MDTEYLKRVALCIAGTLLSVCLIFYLGFHLWRTFTREVEIQPVTETTVEKTAETQGYIFRSEQTLLLSGGSAAGNNTLFSMVSNGSRLAKNAEAARLYTGSSIDVREKVAQIDQQIALLQECASGDVQGLKDAQTIDEEIFTVLSNIRAAGDSGRTADIGLQCSDFLESVNKRMILSGMKNNFASEISALQAERSSLVSGLGSCLETVTAPVSGYYYAACDGYESVFTKDFLTDKNLSFNALMEKLNAAPVNEDRAAGKIVTDSEWFMVCMLDQQYLNVYADAGRCTVYFGIGEEYRLNMEIYKILEGGDRFAILLSTREMPVGFDFSRTQTVRFLTAEYTGFQIPMSAVRIVDGITGVYVLDGSTVAFRPISTLIVTDGYYIVDTDPEEDPPEGYQWLAQHENLITEGKALYHGKVLSG